MTEAEIGLIAKAVAKEIEPRFVRLEGRMDYLEGKLDKAVESFSQALTSFQCELMNHQRMLDQLKQAGVLKETA